MNQPAVYILVVDDDAPLRTLLAEYLTQAGYHVGTAANAAQARAHMQWLVPDAMVLDVMMPGETGIALAAQLRHSGSHVPMLLLSAQGSVDDRIMGLEAGANDYLAKPFEPRELLLRLKNMLVRQPPRSSARHPLLSFGAYQWHSHAQQLQLAGETVHLTDSERKILNALAESANQPVARDDLLQLLGGTGRHVDVLITRLRKKLNDDPARPRYIETVRHQGYCLHATFTPLSAS